MASKAEAKPGFEEGRQEGARLLLDSKADEMRSLAGRLSHEPGAVAALNECAAILRDAADDHAFGQDPEEAKQRRTGAAAAAGEPEPQPLERRSETAPAQSQRAPGDPLDSPEAPEAAEAAAKAATAKSGRSKARAKA
jgi:hypothetical protein